ncbi:MAG TPA: SCO family protein [Tepidisphaeraceae bacterium]
MIAFVIAVASPSSRLDASDAASLGFRPNAGARLPLAVRLTDERARPVVLGEFFTTSPVILVLEYLRCRSLCGVTLQSLIVDTLGKLPLNAGRDFQLVAISIDPRDEPADAASAQAKYAALYNHREGATGMHFLTGSPAAVRQVADIVGFPYRYDSALDEYIHPSGFVVVAPDGVISRYVEGIAISPGDLGNALADAQQGKSQNPLIRLLLLCRLGAPGSGWLAASVMAALTIANIGAALVAIAIFARIRRRRQG